MHIGSKVVLISETGKSWIGNREIACFVCSVVKFTVFCFRKYPYLSSTSIVSSVPGLRPRVGLRGGG